MRHLICLLMTLLCARHAYAERIYTLELLHEGLQSPWALAQLPNSEWLITERPGRLIRLTEQGKQEISGLPDDIFYAGQGGLLDVLVDSDYATTRRLFLSYASGDADANRLVVVSAELRGDSLVNLQSILRVAPDKSTPVHYAGRLAQLPDDTLLVTSGDGFDYREDAQKRDSQLGKTLRIRADGSIPANNPYANSDEQNAHAVFSIGHRNHQGLVVDPQTARIWSHEHGPDGGDEINILTAGTNYGWPVITHGKDYIGATISPFTEYPGMQQPLFGWTPSIAPSGMIFYRGSRFPEFDGGLLLTALRDQSVIHIDLDGNQVKGAITLELGEKRRWRDIELGRDGGIYLLSDGEGAAFFKLQRP